MTENEIHEDAWLVRPCEHYIDEYQDCSSLRGRFHQKFVYGSTLDEACKRWKEDYENCILYRRTQSLQAAEKIVEHEKERRNARLSAAKDNNVWEYRTEPPSDWNQPLPESMKDNKLPKVQTDSNSLCVIS